MGRESGAKKARLATRQPLKGRGVKHAVSLNLAAAKKKEEKVERRWRPEFDVAAPPIAQQLQQYQARLLERLQAEELKLPEVLSAELDAPIEKIVLTPQQLEALDQQRIEEGQRLGEILHDLTHDLRCRDLAAYLKTINDAVLERCSEENQAILDAACAHFLEKFGRKIRDRGESPAIIDQIVRRTGRDAHELITKTVHGFDAMDLGRHIWSAYLSRDAEQLAQVLQQTYELTNRQLIELRKEYNCIPCQDIAAELHTALHRKDLLDRPFPDSAALIYALRGRTKREIQQIEYQFNERYHYTRRTEPEPLLREQIANQFSDAQKPVLLALLEGFNPVDTARQVHELLRHCAEISEKLDPKVDLHPDFAGRFRKDYSSYPVWHKELLAQEAIDELIEHLTPEQFAAVNVSLQEIYGECLTAIFYHCNRPFDPRRIAMELYKSLTSAEQRRHCSKDQDYLSPLQLAQVKEEFRLSSNKELKTIIEHRASQIKALEAQDLVRQALSPLDYLNPDQIYEVERAFEAAIGQELREFMDEHIAFICREDISHFVEDLVRNRITGLSRLATGCDFFALFKKFSKCEPSILDIETRRQRELGYGACVEKIRALLSRKQQNAQEVGSELLVALQELRYEERLLVEHLYFSQCSSTLVQDITGAFDPALEQELIMLLSGVNVREYAKLLQQDFRRVLTMSDLPQEAIALALEHFQQGSGKDPLTAARETFSDRRGADYVRALLVVFAPAACELKAALSAQRALTDDNCQLLIRNLKCEAPEVLAFEASYNQQFARYQSCYENCSGNLILRLRILATRGHLPRRYFSESMLLLEGMNPKEAETLYGLLRAKNIEATIFDIQATFRRYNSQMRILQRSYNALDQEATLREHIHNLPLRLSVINRTLLLLDDYDPVAVADELSAAVTTYSGAALGERVCAILADPRDQLRGNRSIPSHSNWIHEMYHQIRLAYEEISGVRLVSHLLERQVPLKGLGVNSVCYKIYGEASKSAVDFFRLFQQLRGAAAGEAPAIEAKLAATLETLIPPLRERAIHMFDSYFTKQHGLPEFRACLTQYMRDATLRGQALDAHDEAPDWDIPGTEEEQVDAGDAQGTDKLQALLEKHLAG